MQILIDATPLLLRSAGVKNYTYYWIQHLRRQSGTDQILTWPPMRELPPLNHERSVLGPARTVLHLASVHLLPLSKWTIPRADVAAVIAVLLDDPGSQRQTLELVSGDSPVAAAVHSIS